MKLPSLLFVLLILVAQLGAAPVPLNYTQMDLSDGRSLKNVVVKFYDAVSGKLLVVADGKVMLIPLGLVPQPFRDKLKSEAPQGGATTAVVSVQAVPAGEGAATGKATPGAVAPTNQELEDAAQEKVLEKHKQAALARARNYYRYEFQAGSSAISVTAEDFETDQPEPVAGWLGRYRTTGRVFLEFFDSKGYSYSRTTDKFEIITEQKPREAIKVLDFTRK